ncbi:MAG: recombinase A [Polyangiaceae bacterium]|nr:recombinase A [Polyangiaceae bacterium]
MFSMPLAAPVVRDLLRHTLPELEPRARVLPLTIREINEVLPDGGLPRGGVVELATPRGLGQGTSIALSACAGGQAEARLRGGEGTEGAWCAWIDPSATLYAPAVTRAGVDLERLLVVRPAVEGLAKVAVRMAASRAFAVLVVDAAAVPGAWGGAGMGAGKGAASGRGRASPEEDLSRWVNVVRKLSLASEGGDGIVLLLTDRQAVRPLPLPVAMRIEVERIAEDRLSIRVAKDRRGRVTSPVTVALRREGAEGRGAEARGAEARPPLARAGRRSA